MARVGAFVRFARETARSGEVGSAAQYVVRRVRSSGRDLFARDRAYGLARDLDLPHTPPTAAIPISVRPMRESDAPHILDASADVDPAEKWERRGRSELLERGIGTPYVAVNSDDEPCYVQWLFSPAENDAVAGFFHGEFPRLEGDQALLEGAFTPTRHRGKKIMSAGMSHIAARAHDLGARHVLTFVGVDNVASLKGCERAGFVPAIERRQTLFLGRRRVEFRTLSADESRAASVLDTARRTG